MCVTTDERKAVVAAAATVLKDKGVRGAERLVAAALGEATTVETEDKPTQGKMLLDLTGSHELWHTRDRTAYATVQTPTRPLHCPIRSEQYQLLLQREYYLKYGRPVAGQGLADATSVLEAKARFEGDTREIFVRVGHRDDTLSAAFRRGSTKCRRRTRYYKDLQKKGPIFCRALLMGAEGFEPGALRRVYPFAAGRRGAVCPRFPARHPLSPDTPACPARRTTPKSVMPLKRAYRVIQSGLPRHGPFGAERHASAI
jgi:hypothetical protein